MNKDSLKKSLNLFKNRINTNLDLISKINNLNTNSKLTYSDLNQITELAFLKIYLSWEIFLEEIFIKLILISKNHYKIVSYVKPKNYNHAREILKENSQYPDWTNIEKVINNSDNYFKNGFPLSNNLKLIKSELIEMKRIRNNIVHMSQKAAESFRNLVIEKNGFCPKNYCCGDFLLSNKNSSHTYLDFYITKIKDIADRITELKK